jgi:hypothetical protein
MSQQKAFRRSIAWLLRKDSRSVFRLNGKRGRVTDDRGAKKAAKTYIEQTKLLVCCRPFVLAPAGAIAVFKDRAAVGLSTSLLFWFVVADVLLILSVLMGYVVVREERLIG